MDSPTSLNWAASVAAFGAQCKQRQLPVISIPSIEALEKITLDSRYTRLVLKHFEPVFLHLGANIAMNAPGIEAFQVLASISFYTPILSLVEHVLLVHPELMDSPEPILSSLHRLLLWNGERFKGFVRPKALYQLLTSQSEETRVLAAMCLALYMGATEALLDEWLEKFTPGSALKNRIVLEAARDRIFEFQTMPGSFELVPSPLVENVAGVLVPKLQLVKGQLSGFVATEQTLHNARAVARELLASRPVLLSGPSGAGKTFLVESLHSVLRPGEEITRIHLGDQTDSKSLVGTYGTGAAPGTFEWKMGLLAKAVSEGHWVLVEDLDQAPTDVISVLLPLLERRELLIPARDEHIKAAHGFQLFATSSGPAEIIGKRLWGCVDLLAPSETDLVSILTSLYPALEPVAAQFVQVYTTLGEVFSKKNARKVTTRDLFKWAQRVKSLDEDLVFLEAVRCFCGSIDDLELKRSTATLISEILGVPDSKVGPLLTHYVPETSLHDDTLRIGSATLQRRVVTATAARAYQSTNFAPTNHSKRLLEEIAVAVESAEPLLLSGETGTGKTTVIQHLASLCHRKLVVINISQQMEAGDLVGGFKPLDLRMFCGDLLADFDELFEASFSRQKNAAFLAVLDKSIKKSSWKNVAKCFREAFKMLSGQPKGDQQKRRKLDLDLAAWRAFMERVAAFEQRITEANRALHFEFIEGLLVKALKRGDWVLLDELNLAPADTLEGISELLSTHPHLTIQETGASVQGHPGFRLFGCMNPSTDFGKKDLPSGIRSRFTEIYVRSPDENMDDLRAIIEQYIGKLQMGDVHVVNDVAQVYLEAKRLAGEHLLVDGAGTKPHFSIRTLSRTLSYSALIANYGLRRALYEGFSMCFLTLLDKPSSERLEAIIAAGLHPPQLRAPPAQDGHIQFKHYWLRRGAYEVVEDKRYILTPSVEQNLLNLVRATAASYPVLIQGPTSAGKTSMIRYLAGVTGHKFMRINNHEHTDIGEYLGGYVSGPDGLVFQEGPLVEAVRNGYWVVLDELNLAPSDVLEALNRLLDDNRELLIPETQETIKPHPDFLLFATQNPPGVYAGRKILSRAFRNRFLELHFDDIPQDELEIILRERCGIAPSYATKIVQVYRELGNERQSSQVFTKHAFATLRDLFRWANREAVGYEQLAWNGYLLLAERVRNPAERTMIKETIERVMKVEINVEYNPETLGNGVVWTAAMKRLLVLVRAAMEQKEPVLLVGETGCGKTTIVQVLAEALKVPLSIVNAHAGTETGDLVGSQRPNRHRAQLSERLAHLYPELSFEEALEKHRAEHPEDNTSTALFEWVDGPLVQAMKQGHFFLLDEISLADDSVLERLNSVLEPERELMIPETSDHVVGSEQFLFFATMNPGGDYGKKELSPALRNRFTEIWVPSMERREDVLEIVQAKTSAFCEQIVDFAFEFARLYPQAALSLRDILNWVEFIEASPLDARLAAFHGGCMVFVDCLGSSVQVQDIKRAREGLVAKLCAALEVDPSEYYDRAAPTRVGDKLQIGRFSLPYSGRSTFALEAPTTATNALRVVRAMCINKPILLEGSPGVGKTSLIQALADLSGAPLVRINLSEQTDLGDLFGADAPSEEIGQFAWRDAPFLSAMRNGGWVLLDEMNLAPQQVLEGLNACLDHRGAAYIPELDKTFERHPDFRVFAAQNPQGQGGGRKGLPKSFVNRFTVVYMDSLEVDDLDVVAGSLYPQVDAEVRAKLVRFVRALDSHAAQFIAGAPFEFNLRDTMRWFALLGDNYTPNHFYDLVVGQRFRTAQDRDLALKLFVEAFGPVSQVREYAVCSTRAVAGLAEVTRPAKMCSQSGSQYLQCNAAALESALVCVANNWPLLVVGPAASGKTSFLRHLAYLHGFSLVEYSMNSDVDSTDLLGGFDQVERGQLLAQIWKRVATLAEDLSGDSIALLEALRTRDLGLLEQIAHPQLAPLIDEYHNAPTSPRFSWMDGVLVRCIEQGHWLVLDNANLCNPSVLDRLNSLLEVGGTLDINECANVDGSPRRVKIHPNFRLFMTVDPRYGELSRAMRNRGVELFLGPLDERASAFDRRVLGLEARDISELSISTAQPLTAVLPPLHSSLLEVARFEDAAVTEWVRGMFATRATTSEVHGLELPTDLLQHLPASALFELKKVVLLDTLRRALDAVVAAKPNASLLSQSILSRTKSSINVVDVYSFMCVALEQAGWDLESLMVLSSFLAGISSVQFDESKIPIFRDLLKDSAAGPALQYIDLHYDFSKGGAQLEPYWQQHARGFATAEECQLYVKLMAHVRKFDHLASTSSFEDRHRVLEIRKALVNASLDEGVLEILEQTLGQMVPKEQRAGHFLAAFKAMSDRARLNYHVAPSAQLSTLCAELAFFAGNDTRALIKDKSYLSWVDPENDFMARSLEAFAGLGDVPGRIFKDALDDLSVLKQYIKTQHTTLASNPWQELLAKLDLGAGMSSLLELAERRVAELLPQCVFDPAIRQHVLYENYLSERADAQADAQNFAKLRAVFVGDVETEVDASLHERLTSLQAHPLPSIYRPSASRIGKLYSEIFSIREMLRPAYYSALSASQLELWGHNLDTVICRLQEYPEYTDLSDIFENVLVLLKMAVVLKHKSSASEFGLLSPVTLYSGTFKAKTPLDTLRASQFAGFEAMAAACEDAFNTLYQSWTVRRLAEKEQQEADAKDFKQGDEESQVEQEFRALFPDYDGDEVPEKAPVNEDSTLCSLYRHLMNGTCEPLAVALQALAPTCRGADDAKALPGLLVALTPVTPGGNFYLDPSYSESTKAMDLGRAINKRVAVLLETWPEHETLLIVARCCRELAEFPSSTPPARYLSKVEQIHLHLDEWQRYATKEATVQPQIQLVISAVVEWRRLELSTWKSLFDFELKAVEDATSAYWYHLYETLIYNPRQYPDDVKLEEIVRVLVLFVSGATFGQYKYRVALLEAFAKHTSPEIARCVLNVRAFYSLYDQQIEDALAQVTKTLTKELQEVILLASWKDVNIAALKQAAHKNHRQLYKIVHKFRAFVNKGLGDVLTSEPRAVDEVFETYKLRAVPSVEVDTSLLAQRPSALQNIGRRAEMMQDYTERAEACSVPDLGELAESTLAEAKRLRAATPKELTEDTKKELGSLKAEKQRLLSDTLKALKDAGIGTNIKAQVVADQALVSNVLAATPQLPNSGYFYRVVEMLPRLRLAAQTSETDVAHADLRRAMAFVENVVSLVLKQRKLAAQVVPTTLAASYEQLEVASEQELLNVSSTPVEHISSVAAFIQEFSPLRLEVPSGPTTKEWISKFEAMLQQLQTMVPELGVASSLASSLVETVQAPQVAPFATAAEVDAAIVDFSSAVLVTIQRTLSALEALDAIGEDNWLTESVALQRTLVSALGLKSLERKLGQVAALSYGHPALVKTALPFAFAYTQLVGVVRAKVEGSCHGNTRALHSLMGMLHTLTKDGFCGPQETEEEQDGQTQTGQGMGDGDGAQATKNEDDDEEIDPEDLTANNEKGDDDDNQDDGEDNAQEIDGDMAGDLEDVEGSDDDNDAASDLDEEVGELDDLDPSNVDEKMWDDETDAKKEKETDEAVNGEAGDMEAGDDDEPQEQPKDGQEDDAQQQDEGEADDGSGESDAEAQEDAAQDGAEGEELDDGVEEQETLQLPEDLQLDGEGEQEEAEDDDQPQDDIDMEDEAEEAPPNDPLDQADEAGDEAADEEASGPEDDNLEGEQDVDMEPEEGEGEEDGEPEGEPEAEPEAEPKAEDTNEAGANDDNEIAQDDESALHGPDAQEAVQEDQSTSTDQKTESSSSGAAQAVSEEQESMDAGGSAQAESEESEENKLHQEQKDTLKELGDALKEFYDRKINERQEQDDEEMQDETEAANEDPNQVEHAPDAEDYTQALGKVDEMSQVPEQMPQEQPEAEQPEDPQDDTKNEPMDDDVETEAAEGSTQGPSEPSEDRKESSIHAGARDLEDVDMDDEDDEIKHESEVEEHPTKPLTESRALWAQHTQKTHDLSLILGEQLRLILEPTLATKLRGDYKTGKRLNMKRIIPFIASNFKKDKIWLRRTKPSKREYQILIAVDDSRSMGVPVVVDLAFQAIALVASALTHIEAGELAIARFGNDTKIVHPFGQQFNAEAGAHVFSQFGFDQQHTNVARLLERSLDAFSSPLSLELILSDGVCENHDRVQQLVREAHERNVMLVFIVLDALHEGSIMDMTTVSYEGGLKVSKYMESFPFDWYVIVRDIRDLPGVISQVLRQYFAMRE